MSINYPKECDSSRRKTEFLYKAQEDLRILHNIFSEWLHEGLPEDQYSLLPEFLKVKYPYAGKLSKSDHNKFMSQDFTPRSDTICQEICVQRAEFKKSTAFTIDIGEI